MITRFVIAGLLFVTLSSGLAYAFDDTNDPAPSEPAVEEAAPEAPPAEGAPAPEAPAPEAPAPAPAP